MWARNFSKSSELFPGQTSCLRWWTQTLSRCRTARWRMWVEKYRAIIANCWEVRPRPLQLRDVIVRNLRSPTVLSLTTARFSVWSTGHLLRLRISQLRLIQVWRNRSSRREYRNTTMTSRITSRTIQRVTSPEPDWVGIVGVWQQKIFLYTLNWSILCETKTAFNPTTGYCKLCAMEKFFIMFKPGDATLNLRSEFFSHCKHKERHLLRRSWEESENVYLFMIMIFIISFTSSNLDMCPIPLWWNCLRTAISTEEWPCVTKQICLEIK